MFGFILQLTPSGCLGTYPRSVRQRLRELQDMAEAAPDCFKLYDFPRLLEESHAAMAEFLRTSTDELAFVENTTMAIDGLLRTLQFQPGDLILYFDTTHDHTKNIITRTVESTPAGAVQLHNTYPVTDREILQLFRTALTNHRGQVKIAILDTVTALPAARLPFESLIEVAREEGVLTLLDGAHGIGHLPLDLGTLKPDFFVADCHKWLFVPRPCTVFHCPRRHHDMFRDAATCRYFHEDPGNLSAPTRELASPDPPSEVTAHSTECRTRLANNDFDTQYERADAVGSVPCLCIPEALRFRREVCGGEAEIMAYCVNLSRKMASRVASILFTASMEGDFVRDCCMFSVMLPLKLAGGITDENDAILKQMVPFMTALPLEEASEVTKYMTKKLLEEHRVSIAIFIYKSIWWARFSSQVYLQEEDFEHGARALKAVCLEIREGKHLQ